MLENSPCVINQAILGIHCNSPDSAFGITAYIPVFNPAWWYWGIKLVLNIDGGGTL